MIWDNNDLEVTQQEGQQLVEQAPAEGTVIVDVREGWELTRGILPGAWHCPLSRFDELAGQFEAGRHYLVYCEHGIRSLDVAAWLQHEHRIKAKSLRGGFSEWTGPTATAGEGAAE